MEIVLALLISLFGCFATIINAVTSPNPPSKKLTGLLGVICFFLFLAIVWYAVTDIFHIVTFDDDYILPYSSTRSLEEKDINTFDEKKLILARNEIYARHGRLFKDENIQRYFNSKSWYKGEIPPEEFQQEILSPIEQENVIFILEYEQKKGK